MALLDLPAVPASCETDGRVLAARLRRERSRSRLLAAATTLFTERGWNGCRVEDIAEAAGVSTATAYNHFRTKTALIGAVYGPRVIESVEAAEAALGAGEDVVDILVRHVRDLVERTRQEPLLTLAFIGGVLEASVRINGPVDPSDPDDPRALAPLHVGMTRLIAAGQRDGRFRPYPTAAEMAAQLSNLLLLRVLSRPDESPEDSAELALTVLFGALCPQPWSRVRAGRATVRVRAAAAAAGSRRRGSRRPA